MVIVMEKPTMVNFTFDPPDCGSSYCNEFVIWRQGLFWDFDGECQREGQSAGFPGYANLYQCGMEEYNDGWNVSCCMYGG